MAGASKDDKPTDVQPEQAERLVERPLRLRPAKTERADRALRTGRRVGGYDTKN